LWQNVTQKQLAAGEWASAEEMKEGFKIISFPIAPSVELELNMGAEKVNGPVTSKSGEVPSGEEWVHRVELVVSGFQSSAWRAINPFGCAVMCLVTRVINSLLQS
jgi:hypothetical protein